MAVFGMAAQFTAPEFLKTVSEGNPAAHDPWAYSWVYAFAFALGFSTTIAEPALIAVALKAEKLSAGAINAWGLRIAVALGTLRCRCWELLAEELSRLCPLCVIQPRSRGLRS